MTDDFKQTRRDLIALRKKHGADSPIGHRCSNLLEQTENYAKETDRDARKRLAAGIERQMAGLSALRRGQHETATI